MTRPNTFIATFFCLSLTAVLLAGCGSGGNRTQNAKTYDVKATVTAIDAKKPAVTIDHEAIPGLMGAMQMEFAVSDAKLLDGIAAGDKVTGTLTVADGKQTITALKKQP